ncbi:MAG: DsbA family protein [Turneriella sp.]
MAAKAEIIVVFDGYCGWCWGIAETMKKLAADFSDRFDFTALCGGLVTGERIGPLGDFAAYIEKAIPRVEQMTGAVFSEPHRARMRNRNTMQDSRIPAAAFSLILAEKPQTSTMQLADEILSLNFREGRDLSEATSYADLFRSYGLDTEKSVSRIASGEFFPHAEKQFERAREIGAEAFPTIVYGRQGQYFPLCQGYQNYESLAHALDLLYREPPPL